MAARIIVVSGVSTGRSHWIDRFVMRVGSHPDTDVCLPIADLANHALTLDFRDGTYRVYNRSDQPITVNGQEVNAGGSTVWNDGEELQLPGETRLLLETTGDGAPSPPPADTPYTPTEIAEELAETDEDPSQPLQENSALSGWSPKDLMQLGLIVVCFLGIGGILAFKVFAPEFTEAQAEVPKFATIVSDGLSEIEDTDNGELQSMLSRMQQAEAARVRGDTDLARQHFSRLRDTLVRRQQEDQSFPTNAEEAMYRYVTDQLQQLSDG